jgi:xanthine/uracil permease
MLAVIAMAVGLRGFMGRIAIFLGLVLGYVLSWLFDRVFGQITSQDPAAGEVTTHDRVNFDSVREADWLGFPPQTMTGADGSEIVGWHLPDIKLTFVLLVLPAVIAPVAYYVAALVAILFGFSPKFGALVAAVPGGVLGGITVVLYGMIGLLGAKIWIENRVNFANPVNLVPIAAGIIIAIGDVSLTITENFTLSGIALGTIVAIGAYHFARAIAPPHMRDEGAVITVGGRDTQVVEEFVEDDSRADERIDDGNEERRDGR